MCGVDADVAERLELLRPDAYDPSVRVCVRTCPAAAEQVRRMYSGPEQVTLHMVATGSTAVVG